MSQICQDFYSRLYKARDDISDLHILAMKEKLRTSVSLGELQKVLSEMKPYKSPGPNGIILELFRE